MSGYDGTSNVPPRRRRRAPVRGRHTPARVRWVRRARRAARRHARGRAGRRLRGLGAERATASTSIGDFEGWGERPAPLSRRGETGIWEGLVPGIGHGARYKYRIVSRHGGYQVDKADPYGFRCEEPPATASIVWDLDYAWGDGAWMSGRRGAATRSTRRCRSTRCTSARGCASPRSSTAGSATASSRPSWRRTPSAAASRTSS